MTQYMDVSGSLRKLARDCIDIGVEIDAAADVPFELIAKIGAVSFMLNWIADGLDKELVAAAERAKRLMQGQLPSANVARTCSCGDFSYRQSGNDYRCGPNGCYNCPA